MKKKCIFKQVASFSRVKYVGNSKQIEEFSQYLFIDNLVKLK